jgi:hypothetical protein
VAEPADGSVRLATAADTKPEQATLFPRSYAWHEDANKPHAITGNAQPAANWTESQTWGARQEAAFW